MAERILVVDDEETLREGVRFNLEVEGYEVLTAASGEDALKCDIPECDLILLDVMMDGMGGFELARRLKAKPETARVPIIFCTAKDAEDDEVAGLTIGADDYITKPFTIRTLVARVKSVLRRAQAQKSGQDEEIISYEGIKIDRGSQRVTIDGAEAKMPRKEMEILALLLQNRCRVFSREEILARIWEPGIVVCDRTIDVNITRLRQKLGKYGKLIVTRSGYGYGFMA